MTTLRPNWTSTLILLKRRLVQEPSSDRRDDRPPVTDRQGRGLEEKTRRLLDVSVSGEDVGATLPSKGIIDQNFALLSRKDDTDGYGGVAPGEGTMPEVRPVQKPSPPQQQQPRAAQANYKKIEAYAAHLLNEAVAKEKAERYGDAIVDYLQAADMLLLLAKGTPDYTPWKAFSDKAIACQQRVSILIAKRKLAEEAAEAASQAAPPRSPAVVPSQEKKV
jgi:hypothetical protein